MQLWELGVLLSPWPPQCNSCMLQHCSERQWRYAPSPFINVIWGPRTRRILKGAPRNRHALAEPRTAWEMQKKRLLNTANRTFSRCQCAENHTHLENAAAIFSPGTMAVTSQFVWWIQCRF